MHQRDRRGWRMLRITKTFSESGWKIRNEKGATLIEIVILLLIFAISVIPLSRLVMRNLNSGGRYSTMSRAILHAEESMEQIIADYAANTVGMGYNWVIANWSGSSTPNPPAGLTGNVTISAEDTLKGVPYVVVETTVRGTDIPDVVLTTWLINTN